MNMKSVVHTLIRRWITGPTNDLNRKAARPIQRSLCPLCIKWRWRWGNRGAERRRVRCWSLRSIEGLRDPL
jgi:hypothetical protein